MPIASGIAQHITKRPATPLSRYSWIENNRNGWSNKYPTTKAIQINLYIIIFDYDVENV